jgi:F-BAR domain only protein
MRSHSPEKKSSSNLASTNSTSEKKKSKEHAPPVPRLERRQSLPSTTVAESQTESLLTSTSAEFAKINQNRTEKPNEGAETASQKPAHEQGLLNGNLSPKTGSIPDTSKPGSSSGPIAEVLVTPRRWSFVAKNNSQQSQKDAGGSGPSRPSALDVISQIEQEAARSVDGLCTIATINVFYSIENSGPQFKLDIRTAPIEEENADAQTAIANVTNVLRAVHSFDAVARNTLLITHSKLHRLGERVPYEDAGTCEIPCLCRLRRHQPFNYQDLLRH